MSRGATAPDEGGIKIVFDVPDGLVEQVMDRVAQDGFDVQEYYGTHRPRPVRGVPRGVTRIGAERPRRSSARKEVEAVLGGFEALQVRHDLAVEIIGVDTWDAGGNGEDGLAGVRERRRPRPHMSPAGVELRPSPGR